MSLLKRLFSNENPNIIMQPLYAAIIAEARRLFWYEEGEVPDTIDGRFDMIAAILSLVLIRLEGEKSTAQNTTWLTELFISDMDGQLRQIGIGDMVVGKHVGRMMGALGGRMAAYRDGLGGQADLGEALTRNLYRGEAPAEQALKLVANALRHFGDGLAGTETANILAGEIPETSA